MQFTTNPHPPPGGTPGPIHGRKEGTPPRGAGRKGAPPQNPTARHAPPPPPAERAEGNGGSPEGGRPAPEAFERPRPQARPPTAGGDAKPLRKEVIQPHLPVRLPCYDFVPITGPAFDRSPWGHGLRASPTFMT